MDSERIHVPPLLELRLTPLPSNLKRPVAIGVRRPYTSIGPVTLRIAERPTTHRRSASAGDLRRLAGESPLESRRVELPHGAPVRALRRRNDPLFGGDFSLWERGFIHNGKGVKGYMWS